MEAGCLGLGIRDRDDEVDCNNLLPAHFMVFPIHFNVLIYNILVGLKSIAGIAAQANNLADHFTLVHILLSGSNIISIHPTICAYVVLANDLPALISDTVYVPDVSLF